MILLSKIPLKNVLHPSNSGVSRRIKPIITPFFA